MEFQLDVALFSVVLYIAPSMLDLSFVVSTGIWLSGLSGISEVILNSMLFAKLNQQSIFFNFPNFYVILQLKVVSPLFPILPSGTSANLDHVFAPNSDKNSIIVWSYRLKKFHFQSC
jgi:hypothetical protein